MAKPCEKVVRDFYRVHSSEPTVRLITIQVVFDQDGHAREEARRDIEHALNDMQCFSGAQVVESCMIKETFDEACVILSHKSVEV